MLCIAMKMLWRHVEAYLMLTITFPYFCYDGGLDPMLKISSCIIYDWFDLLTMLIVLSGLISLCLFHVTQWNQVRNLEY